ncbi:MAG: LysR family transcriptional regulator, partial [Myxococcota bacterium]
MRCRWPSRKGVLKCEFRRSLVQRPCADWSAFADRVNGEGLRLVRLGGRGPFMRASTALGWIFVMVCWDDYRFVLAVTREGSLSAAARSLAVSQPTVARRIEQLEADLGIKILSRDGSQIDVTEAGQEISRFAERIEEEAHAIGRCVERRRQGARPHVRVATTRGLAMYWLAPHLRRLKTESCARLSIQVSLDFVDLGHYHADIAVRMSNPADDSLLGRRVASVNCGLYASKTYLSQSGTPTQLSELARHAYIGSEGEIANLPQVRILKTAVSSEPPFGADCVSVQIALARNHMGVGTFPCFMADIYPDLQRILPDLHDVPVPLWILMNPDL